MVATTRGKPRWRFTIGSMRLGIVYVAGLFALPGGWGIVAFALSIPCVFFVLAKRLVSHGELRNAAFPVHIGLYTVAGSRFDPVSGAVALLIEPNPDCPRGFLRTRPRAPRGPGLGVYGTNLCINLDGVWCYCDDD
jgi:hypothetical protein